MKMKGMKNQVWVTSAVTDEDAKKSIVLANSLKHVLSNRNVAILASCKVAPKLREQLHYEFDHVFILEEDRNTANLKPEEFVKLSALTLKSFEKCVFVSPSMMFLKNADEIFDRYENSQFVCPENDSSLPIFMYEPSMKAYNILKKVLATRNGTPVDKYIQNWFRNQHNQDHKYLDPKYNKKLSLENDQYNSCKSDTVIVDFVDDTMLLKDWKDPKNTKLDLVQCYAIKKWIELYNGHVSNNPTETDANLKTPLEYTKEPIAIVGMSCRYPGSNNLEEFWNLLFNNEDGTGNPPPFRWLKEQSSRNRPDCRKTNAGFLKVPVDEFDAKFFGISPKEVLFMDPQHRLLHELIWEGLEDAAIDPLKLRGSNGSVFMGSWTNDFKDILLHSGVSEFYRTYMGNSVGAAAARISFLLGLTGPSVATESGCSSAMVAVHLACRSLQLNETNMALACGVNLLLHPFDKDEMPMVISPEGHCKTFDANADGFARGEGCGVLVLKRLSDAIKDGDHVWALIRGSGMSQEGVSRSMGTPTIHCEALAMQQALHDAHVEPCEVSYVEAHGTGTVVGDPLEVSAIAKAYSKNRTTPLIIGSVKTNVGHTESCSGITGIMKVVLSMHHEIIPPHRNFQTLNPALDLDAVPAVIPLSPMDWKKQAKPRIAGVSSFGITGTDAHAIIEEAPEIPVNKIISSVERPQHILKISAKTEEALDTLLEKYADNLQQSQSALADIAYTSNVGRANFNYRAVTIGKTKEDIIATLKSNQTMKKEVTEELGKVCFLFTGQGSQYSGMAKQLYATNPVFQMHFDYCDQILNDMYKISIRDVLWGESEECKGQVSRTIYSQTSIFCVEYALLKLWESWGVKPDYALGHSLGEFAAAVCAGILSPQDAIKLVAERSRLIDELPRGKMLVIKADKPTVATMMKVFAGNDHSKILDYAALNSPQQTVVAGDSQVILDFAEFCTGKNLKSIVLEATHAFHSKHMDPMLEEYRQVASTVKPGEESSCQYISGMLGSLVEVGQVDAEYWVQHTRQKVEFLNASKIATNLGCQTFIEVGPQPVLSALTMMNNDGMSLLCLPSLKRNENEWDTLLTTVAKLYLNGMTIDWEGFEQFYARKKVRLPHYPFIGKKFWPDMMAATGNTIHPLLGSSVPNASSTKLFQNGLNLRTLEYVKDHAIGTTCIFPGAGYLEMCLAAGHATVDSCHDTMSSPTRPMKVENLSIEAPLALEESKTCQVQVVVNFNSSNGDSNKDWNDMSIKIFHRLDNTGENVKWLSHAAASYSPLPTAEEKNITFDVKNFNNLRQQPSDDKMITQTYEKLASVGLRFGPLFQSLEKVWKDNSGMLAKVKIPVSTEAGSEHQYIVHPVVLDAMIQAVMMERHCDKIKKKLYVPISIEKFIWFTKSSGQDLYIYCTQDSNTSSRAILVDEFGIVLAVMSGVELIDTTVKAVESVLEQQTSAMPDLWEESWRGKIGPMQHRIRDDIISKDVYPQEFKDYIENQYNVVSPSIENIFTKLEEYVYYIMMNCLYECGWKPEQGAVFQLEDFVKDLKIGTEHTKFVHYFLQVIESEGILSKQEDATWKIVSQPESHEGIKSHLASAVFTDDIVKLFDPTRLICRLGENLTEVFRGKQSALSILFPEDTKKFPTVTRFYDDYSSCFRVGQSVVDIFTHRLKSWLEQMSKEEKIVFRIIEIGAGTGIFTSLILPVLEELGIDTEYTYTDISPAFFSAAEKRFEKSPVNFKFKKLNIEEDPISQGFAPEYYDYAIGSDVIHATKDVCSTLRNIRKVLRVGGNLDIMEQIEKNRIITFIFGLMEGFWRFEDSELRADHCILTAPAWNKCLQQSGFKSAVTFPSFNRRHGLISTWAVQDVDQQKLEAMSPSWLVFSNPECTLSSFISDQLTQSGRAPIQIRPATDFKEASRQHFQVRVNIKADFETLMDTLKTRKTPVEGIVYLWGMDKTITCQDEILQPYFYIAQTLGLLKQKLPPRLYAVTQGVAPVGDVDLSHFHPSSLWGFTKSFRNENTDVNCRCISVTNDANKMSPKEMVEVYQEMWCDDKEPQITYHNGSRHVARFQPLKATSQDLSLPTGTNRFRLILPDTKSIGDLQFGPLDHLLLDEGEVEIQVKASALNFRDVFSILKPSEEFKNINSVGFDFAGEVRRVGTNVTKWVVGDHVFGVNIKGLPLPSHLKLDQEDVIRVPDNMTFCEAATLPAVFATSYHCLVDIAKVQPSDIVLIHTASGGVGLSAIDVLKHIGATIIATAGSKRKQNYLRSIGIQHIFHSRNTNYGDEILKLTNGKGVDVVLNSLTSEGFKEATLKACGHGARFVEMSKLSIWKPEEVKQLRPDVQYTIVDLSTSDQTLWRSLLANLKDLADQKVIKPIPYVRFDGTNVRDALQYLQKAKHIGKVVCCLPELRLQDGEYKAYTPMFNDRSSYLITGGLGGIGFEVAKWMIEKGAKNILLASRSPPNASAQGVIDQLNVGGANVLPVQLDVGDYDKCKEFLETISDKNLPQLRGIMHAAGTLSDGLISNQEWEKLSSTFNTKVKGTLNLHELTKGYPLEHFVLFSSVASLFGSPGQSNHAAGNHFEDTFAHYRHSVGLCATAVNWGQWGEVGVATEVDLPGMKALSTLQGISALEYILKTQRLQTCVVNMESFVLFSKLSPQTAVYLDERIWKAGSSSSTSMTIKSDEFWQQYDSKKELFEKLDMIKIQLKDILRKILKLDAEEAIDDDGNFQEMGVDSLMFVEIKNAVQSLLGDRVAVSASALRDCNNISLLSDQLLKLIEGDESTTMDDTPATAEEIAALIREDCQLPEAITAVGKEYKKIGDITSVLLTGATGTLGPYILKQLCDLQQIQNIYCLVRSNKSATGYERLCKSLEQKGLSVNMDKITCVEGNVANAHLGMEDNDWNTLTEQVDAVFHCAVKAHHTQYYKKRDGVVDDVRCVNICGTKNVLEFACEGQVKHVYSASSLLSVASTDSDDTLSESWPKIEDFDGITNFAYAISKFVGDVLMKEAVERNVPTKVFRFPLIAGDSKSGKFTLDQNHLMLRYFYIMKIGMMPSNPFPLALLPVDICASTSIKLFFNQNLSSDIFNITHQQPDLDQEFPELAERLGYPVSFVEFSEFTEKLFNEPDDSSFSLFKDMYKDEEELMSVYTMASSLQKWMEGAENFWTSKKLTAALPDFYPCTERTIDCLARDLRFAKSQGWFEKLGLVEKS